MKRSVLLLWIAVLFVSACSSYPVAESREGRLLNAAAAAYDVDPSGLYEKAEPRFSAAGFKAEPKAITGGPNGIHSVLIDENEDGVIVSFRGTLPPSPLTISSARDWINNFMGLDPDSIPGYPGRYHGGFWKAADELWPQVREEVLSRMKEDKKLFLTGHSKGGAVATITAIRLLREEDVTVHSVTVFGSPRVMDETAAAYWRGKIRQTNYEAALDLVPHLPPNDRFIDVASNAPGIGDIFEGAKDWDYANFGDYKMINTAGEIESGGLLTEAHRWTQMTTTLMQGLDGLKKMALSHKLNCDQPYMRALAKEIPCETE